MEAKKDDGLEPSSHRLSLVTTSSSHRLSPAHTSSQSIDATSHAPRSRTTRSPTLCALVSSHKETTLLALTAAQVAPGLVAAAVLIDSTANEAGERHEYFAPTLLLLLLCALATFVASAIWRTSTIELRLASIASMLLCATPLAFFFFPPTSQPHMMSLRDALDVEWRIVLVVTFALVSLCFGLVAELLRRDYSWRTYMAYANAERRRLFGRLLIFWSTWQFDLFSRVVSVTTTACISTARASSSTTITTSRCSCRRSTCSASPS